ncbi:MAG: hypothetical protein PVI75_04115 [Gammaproteobacteria bacterium]
MFLNWFIKKPTTPYEINQAKKLIDQLHIPEAMEILQKGLAKYKDNKSKDQIRIALAAIYCKIYVNAYLKDKTAPKEMHTYYSQKAYNTLNKITDSKIKRQKLIEFGESYRDKELLLDLIIQPKELIARAKNKLKIKNIHVHDLHIAYIYLRKAFKIKHNINESLLSHLSNNFYNLGIFYHNKLFFSDAIKCIKYAMLANPKPSKEMGEHLTTAAKNLDKALGKDSKEWQQNVTQFLTELRNPKKKEKNGLLLMEKEIPPQHEKKKEKNEKPLTKPKQPKPIKLINIEPDNPKKKNIPLKKRKKNPPPIPKKKPTPPPKLKK